MAVSKRQNPTLPASRQHQVLIFTLLITALAIPISVWATLNQVNYFPQAANGDVVVNNPGANHTPTFPTKLFGNTVNCQVNTPCSASFSGSDANAVEPLSLEINFLPSGLSQNTCEQSTTPRSHTVTCSFSGTPTQTGSYLLLLVLKDASGFSTQKSVTLNVK